MQHKFGKIIIISFGGSIINPGKINIKLLKDFRRFILKWVRRGKIFIIVAGGGAPARDYQKAGNMVIKLSDEDKDWIGIHATRLNAHLLRTIFSKDADPVVIDSHLKSKARKKNLRYKVAIASGWRPGWSTDYIGLQLAEDFRVGEAVIAGNISYVYTTDPNKNKKAKTIHNLTWKKYRKMIPAKWTPGFHSPVDPIGAKLADEKKLKAIIVSGTDFKNLDKLLAGKNFKGTIIS